MQHKKFDSAFVIKGLLPVLTESEQTLHRNNLPHLGAHAIARFLWPKEKISEMSFSEEHSWARTRPVQEQ